MKKLGSTIKNIVITTALAGLLAITGCKNSEGFTETGLHVFLYGYTQQRDICIIKMVLVHWLE